MGQGSPHKVALLRQTRFRLPALVCLQIHPLNMPWPETDTFFLGNPARPVADTPPHHHSNSPMPHRRRTNVTFTEIEETGEAVLFIPAEQRAVVVNATAAIVWLLCNGERDAAALTAELTAAAGKVVPVDDVRRILDQLTAEGVLHR